MNKPDSNNKPQRTRIDLNAKRPLSAQEASSAMKTGKKVFLAPIPGFQYNPLTKFPRNNPCPCRSGKKFKVCCLSKLPPVVSNEEAAKYTEQMKTPNLTFVTQENLEEMKVAADMHGYWKEQKRLEAEKAEKEQEALNATPNTDGPTA